MDNREIEKVITATLGSGIADFKLGGKLRKLAKVIKILMNKTWLEGLEHGKHDSGHSKGGRYGHPS